MEEEALHLSPLSSEWRLERLASQSGGRSRMSAGCGG